MLELKNIYKYYNPGTVNEMCLFKGFNLTVKDGEFLSQSSALGRESDKSIAHFAGFLNFSHRDIEISSGDCHG